MSNPPASRTSTYGWLAWFLGAAFFAYGFAHRVAPSVMFDYLMRDFEVGAGGLGNLSACYFYAYAAMQIPVGILLDRFGTRVLLTLAAVVCALGSSLFAAADVLTVAYVGRLLIGAGAGVGFIATLMIASQFLPSDRFASVAGLTISIAMLGGIAGQAPLGALIDSMGWRATHNLAAAVGLGFAIVAWWFIKPGRSVPSGRETPPRPFMSSVREVLGLRPMWLAAFACGALSTPILSFAVLWGLPFLSQSYGLSRAMAGFGASLFLIGLAIGGPTLGHLSDRLGRRKPFLIAAPAVLTVLWCTILFVRDLPILVVLAAVLALGLASSVTPLTYAIARDVSPAEVRGMTGGLVNFFALAGGAIMQPLIGVVLDWQWDGRIEDGVPVFDAHAYAVAFMPFPIFSTLTIVATLFMPRERA